MPDQPSESQPAQRHSNASFIQWLIVSLILITALSLLAVHLPERLKLLLVYAVVYGLISGGALTTLAIKLGVPVKRTLILSIVLLTILGQSLILYLSHQRYQEATLKQFKTDKTSIVIDRMLRSGEPPEDPEARKEYEQVIEQFEKAKKERREKEQQLLEISSYLQHRISPIAKLESPWPFLFWLLELISCCAAAIWASQQVAKPDPKSPTEEGLNDTVS
ncbi:hypothetical protein [Gimesia fumaroli]|uniref:Uncharacterized protein n=1 Tax=Gimesia fumaroli TaxID=2527976 RepID=A0A518IG71_9PLAN|nr:hypothetical protein [Gimesia fumaroli]QDV52076.1 hypothetical protein Enr17x_41350 [Gimesia fumaroli]